MLWLLVLSGLCVPCRNAEPTACSEDSHCPEEYYCETDAYSCRQCLQCADFKRAPPSGANDCVKSVVECGACLEQKSHGTNHECGPKTNIIMNHKLDLESKEIRLPVYAWVLLVLFVAVIIGGVTLIPWINRVTYTSVSRSEIQMPPVVSTNDNLESAWSSPPAYNTVVNIPNPNIEQEPALYIKPVETAPPSDTRESADHQATRPYSPPNYIRGPQLSPISTPDRFSIHNNTGESSVDGPIAVRSSSMPNGDVLQTGTISNLVMEECPTVTSSATAVPAADGRVRSAPPLVVFNNNVHLQSLSISGASIVLPQSSNSVLGRQ